MRHQSKINQLGRTTAHRHALLANLASALIEHKRINTTLAKAKALRGYVEPLITKSKNDTTHSRRMVFRSLQNKEAVSELFREVAPKVAERPGGYTRIIKTGFRQGDSAEMCIIELVDFNDIYTKESKTASKKTRRSRRGAGSEAKPKAGEKAAKAPASEKASAKEDVKAAATAEAEVEAEEVEKVEAKAEAPVKKDESEDDKKEDSN